VSTTDPTRRLLEYVRGQLANPAPEYAEPPVAISGGYDTEILSFRLRGAPAEWSRPLILRRLGPEHDPNRALRERDIQNAVADLGFPAPRVLAASADPGPIDGAFLVMERIPGRPMLEVRKIGAADVLSRTQLRLHALDTDALLRTAGRTGGRDAMTFDGLLAQCARRIAARSIHGLGRAVDWLTARRPAEPARPAICHGDFHPQNILMEDGVVTGVIDWPNALVADPAYDVATTRVILGLVPLELSTLPTAARILLTATRPLLLAQYLAGYRRGRPIDGRALGYYEAAACLRQLVRIGEQRLTAASAGRAPGPLDASSFGDRLCARFSRITGIAPTLPAAPAPTSRLLDSMGLRADDDRRGRRSDL
jgi:aminoglycoside phosphotransferase (APT) family kinase protein